MAECVDLLLGELAVEPADADDADVVDLHAHDGAAVAGVDTADCDAAHLELSRAGDLLAAPAVRPQLVGVGPPLRSHDEVGTGLSETGELPVGRVDHYLGVAASKAHAGPAEIGDLHLAAW